MDAHEVAHEVACEEAHEVVHAKLEERKKIANSKNF